MSRTASGFLLVRVGPRRVGLELSQVLAVMPLGEVHPVPVVEMAVRGLVMVQGRMLPLVHLRSLLEGKACPAEPGTVGVVISIAGRRLCLEVEDAEVLVREPVLPVPDGEALPWAVGVARYADKLVPLLDLPALSTRLMEVAAS
jgi:chemotaxis signal transduction protein